MVSETAVLTACDIEVAGANVPLGRAALHEGDLYPVGRTGALLHLL